jgi:hypothetical protein
MGNLIYKKIHKIMVELGAVGKTGKNEHQRYRFREIDEIYNKLNPLLREQGVVCFPTIAEGSLAKSYRQNSRGSAVEDCSVVVKYRYVAVEDGSEVEVSGVGSGSDVGDKALYKALAGADKYAIIQMFKLPTEDNLGVPSDPEHGEGNNYRSDNSIERHPKGHRREVTGSQPAFY